MEFYHSLGNLKTANVAGKIRGPKDFVLLSLNILELINTWGSSEDADKVIMPYMYIDTDRYKRVFIVKNNQIVSFAFPFSLYTKTDITGVQQLYVNFRDITLDAIIISQTITMANALDIANVSYAVQMQGINLKDKTRQATVRVLEQLLMMEPSYIRYDFDKPFSNGCLHPLYHLDVNYSKNHTYKLGLYDEMTLPHFKDILDKKTDCLYTHSYSRVLWMGQSIKNMLKIK